MTDTQIKYFFAVLEYGGFSAAANEMYISQPSLSKQIKALETELGIELFSRANKQVSLTDGGKLFLEYATSLKNVYIEMNQTLSCFRERASQKRIAIGTLPLMHDYHIAEQLAIFQETMKNIEINITEENQGPLLSLLSAKKLDMAILRLDYLDTELYDISPMYEDKFVFVCSNRQARVIKKRPLSLNMLTDIPFILLCHESDLYRLCVQQFQSANFEPNISCNVYRHLYMLNLVQAGMGVTILPRDMINTSMFPNLTIIPFKEALKTTIGVVRLKHQNNTFQADLLYRFFTENKLLFGAPR